ncbi:type VI secretion system contractile sheath small subunit [Erwinia endophytica]|uniref:type VI secretion system contractile sheath small subunit n=1 Tax=Erwinia endophytica TaxID=1563158 RepID=UPI0023AA9382|nr:type VI secretion system contractile sheath small subunit [Erwinia endophytica]
MSANSFKNERPNVHVNVKLGLHTGQAQKMSELLLRLLVTGGASNASNDEESQCLSERKKINH